MDKEQVQGKGRDGVRVAKAVVVGRGWHRVG